MINLNPSGMTVKLTEHIRGMVPKTHLSDIILKNPERKYTEGMKVKCRVSERLNTPLTRRRARVHLSLGLLVHAYLIRNDILR